MRYHGTVRARDASARPRGAPLLTLFPSAYVDNSLLTAVLLGVLLLWLLTEQFGWPQSGLVVPGYLAGVFVIQPLAGVVVLGEAIATLAISWALVEGLPRILPMDRAFGRYRFFLILLVSVGVRLYVEGGTLQPALASLGVELSTPLNSLGLVLVPLTANAMWRTGLFRGLPMLALPTLAVYLLLQYVLLPHTNLSFAQFELTYEDLSRDFISSPRAYMLLLVGALMATHMAIRYGWDAGGIIIPGLLAVTWVHPDKLAATMVEVLVTVGALRLLHRMPLLRSANLTGMRPLVLAFVASYAVKLVVSFAMADRYPGLRLTDLFGFGYLLPSLIAVRCWRYGSLPRVLFPALSISLVAFVVGTGVGVGLEQLRPLPEEHVTASIDQRAGPAWRAVTEVALPPTAFPDSSAWIELRDAWEVASRGEPWNSERMRADVYPDGVVLHSGGLTAHGTAWLRHPGADGLLIVVPEAASAPGLAEAGVVLAEVLDATVLLLSPDQGLRLHAADSAQAVLELISGPTSGFRVTRRLPDVLDLKRLAAVVPGLIPAWDLPSGADADARLTLPEASVLDLALRRFDAEPDPRRAELYDPIGRPFPPSGAAAGDGRVPDLLFLRRAVLQPLLNARSGDPRWARLAAAQAAQLGLLVSMDDDLITLGPDPSKDPPRYSLWLRREAGEPVVYEVLAGRRQHLAAEVARTWWAGTHAAALLVHDAGADLDAQAVQRAAEHSPELSIVRALVLATPGTTVVNVDAYREDEYPGADVVLSIGRPLGASDRVPDYLDPVRRLVEGSGGTVVYYDGDYQRIRFYDPSNPTGDVVRYAGGQYVTAYLSPFFRDRFATPATSPALRSLLEGARIELQEARLDDLLAASPLDPARASADFAPLLASLARATTTGHPGELQRLQRLAAQRRMKVWAFLDPDDGMPYLVVDGRDERLVSALARSRGALAGEGADSAAVRLYGEAAALAREAP
ncbi:MAG: poly-gamma-glutamate biosynthesis protein PgsC/CapC [Pseudomonadota bacterium]